MTADFKPIKMAVSHGPDLRFEGRVLHEYSTQNNAGSKDRWTELRLWETPAGNWIAEAVGCSRRHGEGEIREAAVIVRGRSYLVRDREGMTEIDHPDADAGDVQRVMDHFQWTTAAKAFAREMGWDVIRRVE